MEKLNDTFKEIEICCDNKYYHDVIWYPDKQSLDQTIKNYTKDVDIFPYELKIIHILKENDNSGQLMYRLILVL